MINRTKLITYVYKKKNQKYVKTSLGDGLILQATT